MAAWAARDRQATLECAERDARQWIAAGGVDEVRHAWLTARNKGDYELQAIYANALTEAGENAIGEARAGNATSPKPPPQQLP